MTPKSSAAGTAVIFGALTLLAIPHASSAQSMLSPELSGTVISSKKKSMGGGYGEAKATLYRNGLLVVESHAVSSSYTQGTRAQVLVVGSDARGRALFVSPVFKVPTACSKPDTCSSDRRDIHRYTVNPEVARYISTIQVYVKDGGTSSLRDSIRTSIVNACGAYDDLPAGAKAGLAAETGFAGCGPR
jgi:hypothetical protein